MEGPASIFTQTHTTRVVSYPHTGKALSGPLKGEQMAFILQGSPQHHNLPINGIIITQLQTMKRELSHVLVSPLMISIIFSFILQHEANILITNFKRGQILFLPCFLSIQE